MKSILLMLLAMLYGRGLFAQTACDPAIPPQNVSSLLLDGIGVQLSWDAVDSSLACQIKVTTPGGNTVTKGTAAGEDNLNLPAIFLTPGQYSWKVRCACSFSPLTATPFSEMDTFFVDFPNCGTVTDIDGNTYKTVQIGNQCWMQENLMSSRYADGSSIPHLAEDSAWNSMYYADRAFSYYENDSAFLATYGALYTWPAAVNGQTGSNSVPSGIQGACPDGWHIPSEAEWDTLINYLGGSSIAGGVLKAQSDLWDLPNSGATNASGFTSLPGGYRLSDGSFSSLGEQSYFWSATNNGSHLAWYRSMESSTEEVSRNAVYNLYGLSCRCVRD